MDSGTRRQVEGLPVGKGLLKWLVSVPFDRKASPIDRTVSFISRVCMLLIVVVVLITGYEVVMRYVFRSPTLWVNEMTLWLGSVIFLVAGMYTMQRRAHIRITAVYDIVPHKVKLAFDVVSALVIVAYAALFIIPSFPSVWDTVMRWERLGTYWNPPVPATVKPLCLIVTFLIALQAVNNLIVDWRAEPGNGEQKVPEDLAD